MDTGMIEAAGVLAVFDHNRAVGIEVVSYHVAVKNHCRSAPEGVQLVLIRDQPGFGRVKQLAELLKQFEVGGERVSFGRSAVENANPKLLSVLQDDEGRPIVLAAVQVPPQYNINDVPALGPPSGEKVVDYDLVRADNDPGALPDSDYNRECPDAQEDDSGDWLVGSKEVGGGGKESETYQDKEGSYPARMVPEGMRTRLAVDSVKIAGPRPEPHQGRTLPVAADS
jgi:hypothetical protein